MKSALEAIRLKAAEQLEAAADLKTLEELRVALLGKKGELTAILKSMGKLSPEERPAMGQLVNQVRAEIEGKLEKRNAELKAAAAAEKLKNETLDVTLPGIAVREGHRHPLNIVLDEVKEIFLGMGFDVVSGPEVELDYYNFEALNLPPEHPARDMQDSFYFSPGMLLRTQTSGVQVHVMEAMKGKVPVKVISPGVVYRRDDDATHSPMFHQMEGLLIDKNVTFADLRGTLLTFARQMFGEDREIRLRPSYFPFTEPSAEVDISCFNCGGAGCRLCKGTGWIEILGSGQVHPRVLEMSGYDPEECTGFAFGMGIERVAMLKYGINDLRLLFDNDVRFLGGF